jgi:hypothetical protein
MKPLTKDTLEVQDQKQKDMEADLERDPGESHWHSVRENTLKSHYAVVKELNPEGEWHGLYKVICRKGGELPRELQGSFTSPDLALKAITSYLDKQKVEKEVL